MWYHIFCDSEHSCALTITPPIKIFALITLTHTRVAVTTYSSIFLHLAADPIVVLNYTNDGLEEDEVSSLWSTTSSFIILFISTLLYSTVISIVKVNMQMFLIS